VTLRCHGFVLCAGVSTSLIRFFSGNQFPVGKIRAAFVFRGVFVPVLVPVATTTGHFRSSWKRTLVPAAVSGRGTLVAHGRLRSRVGSQARKTNEAPVDDSSIEFLLLRRTINQHKRTCSFN